MDFGRALTVMTEDGVSVHRKGWNGKGMYIYLAKDISGTGVYEPVIVLRAADGRYQPGWLASQADMLATDWCYHQLGMEPHTPKAAKPVILREDSHAYQATTLELLHELEWRMSNTQNSNRGCELGRLCQEAWTNLSIGVLAWTPGRTNPPLPAAGQ